MADSSISPLPELNAAIQGQNLFKNLGVFRSDNVWGRGASDVTSFNVHASDAIAQALTQVQKSKTDKVTSLVLTASQGQGKTHLLNRVRRQLANSEQVVFIYTHVLNFTDLDRVNFYFQQAVVDSLSRSLDADGITQWQAIAASMINQASPKNPRSPQVLVKQFDQAYEKGLRKGKNLIELLTQRITADNKLNPYLIRAVLWTLSRKAASYAEKWLAGEVLEASHAQYLGLPPALSNDEDQEAYALNIVRQLLCLVGYYRSIIICFDEIDAGDRIAENSGLTSPQVTAFLIKALYDTLEQSGVGQGIVIVTVMLPDTHQNIFRSLSSGGVGARLSTFTPNNKPIELEFLNSRSMVSLVRLYLDHFYAARQLVPATPLYPFTEEQLKQYAKVNKPTIREALRWCADNFKVEAEVLPEDPAARFELALSREQDNDFTEVMEDSELLGNVLRFCFEALVGQSFTGETTTGEQLNGLILDEVMEVTPKSKNGGWINFKLVGREQDQQFRLGVMVLQHGHGLAVGAGMNRITDYKTFDLTRGCIVRAKSRKIKSTWKGYNLLRKLVKRQGGEWVDLQDAEMLELLKLYGVYEQASTYQLTTEQVFDYTRERIQQHPLLLEILSNPSGDVDETTIEEIDELFPDKDEPEPVDESGEIEDLFADDESDDEPDDKPDEPGAAVTPSSATQPDKTEPENIAIVETESPEDAQDVSAIAPTEETPEPATPPKTPETWFNRSYTGTNIAKFEFNGSEYEVTSWREFLITVCTLMKLMHGKDFEKIREIRGRKNVYFSTNPEDLIKPEKMPGSAIYIETYATSNKIVRRVYDILVLFGYPEDCLEITLHES